MCVCGSYSPNSSESPYSSNSPHFTLPDRHPLPLTSSTMAEGLRNNNAASLSQDVSTDHDTSKEQEDVELVAAKATLAQHILTLKQAGVGDDIIKF